MTTQNIKGAMPVNIALKKLVPGEDYKWTIYIKDQNKAAKDTTGWSMAIKGRANNANGTELFSLTTSSGITMTAAEGKFSVKITAAITATIKVTHVVWDCKVTDNTGDVFFPLKGTIEVEGVVTK